MAKNKKSSTIGSALRRMFGMQKKQLSFQEEEALQSPGRVIARNFFHRPTAVFGVVVFLAIFLFVMIGPIFMPINLGYSDASLANISPGYFMMDVPSQLISEGIHDIIAGPTYGLGLSENGKLYSWGYTRISDVINMKDIPAELTDGSVNIEFLAAGSDHAVAIDEDNNFYFWGNDRLRQAQYESNSELNAALRRGTLQVKQLEAGNQFSIILDTEGNVYLWGNSSGNELECRDKDRVAEGEDKEPRQYQGNIEKVAVTDHAYIALLKDGTVAYTGLEKDNALITNLPTELTDGSVRVVDIAGSSQNVAAVDETGKVWVWGVATHGEKSVPEMASKPVKIYGGRYHYTVLLEDGDVISWGDDMYGQASVPSAVENAEIAAIYSGGNQNYAVTTDGKVLTWGLKGFLCGTDDLGRDVLARIVNGGKMTMTVGAIAVIISTIIGLILGGIAGYFGGKVDMALSRVAEVIGGLPFLPFALILSAIIPRDITVLQRMYIIMCVLGVLSWVPDFRLVRAQILSQREQEYVTAAKALGVGEGHILRKHIIPNVMSVLLVSITLNFATCMLTESTLSYLGFGIPLPTPTWGNMLNSCNNSIVIQQYWWRWVFPAAIFGLCTICINLVGDGLRDAMDPKSNGR